MKIWKAETQKRKDLDDQSLVNPLRVVNTGDTL